MNALQEEEVKAYDKDGYIIIRNLFTTEEINLLGQTARADNEMDQASTKRDDGEGNAVRLALWNHPGDGIYGMFARSKRLVDRVEQLQNGAQRCQSRRRMGVASGLWILVPKRCAHPKPLQCDDRC